jgi:hypothetical protein
VKQKKKYWTKLIRSIILTLGKYLVNIVHKFPEWKAVKEKIGTSSLRIEKEKILLVLGRSEQEIKEIISSENAYEKCKNDLKC